MSKINCRLSWRDFDKWVSNLTKNLRARALQFDAVYGPARGGMIPAICLSHSLGIRFIPSPDVEILGIPRERVLWVDDIVDSGRTVSSPEFSGFTKACWLARERFRGTPPGLLVGKYVPDNWWITFPWENNDAWRLEMEEYDVLRSGK